MRFPLTKKPGNPCGRPAVGIAFANEGGTLLKEHPGHGEKGLFTAPLCKEHLAQAQEKGISTAQIGDPTKNDLVCHEQVRIGHESSAPTVAGGAKK